MLDTMSEYTFNEFLRHFQDYPRFRENNHVSDADMLEIKVIEYMKAQYDDFDEWSYRATSFFLINTYLAENAAAFNIEDFAILYDGDDGEDGVVSLHTLRAVHDLFTRTPGRQLPEWPSVEDVKELARDYRDADA